ncbi:MAG: hypothetical protein CXR30_09135 [Geobacter sp.]|nr:MAG: hypothetical protein CXR30_09135 [Geobacter sp.]
MVTPAVDPFYMDWKFWSVVMSSIAILLSQLPPIRLWLKPRRVDVEVNSRIQITHKVGNPNVGLHLSLINSGGRELRVCGLKLHIYRDSKPIVTLPAQNYFDKPTDTTSVLLVPLQLKPDEYWSHSVNFLNFFDRSTEKKYRASETALGNDIQEKLKARAIEDKNPVKADPMFTEPFILLFQQLFIWEPGEYVVELTVDTVPVSATYSKKYRFTLYESDTAELRKQVEDYPYGAGIHYHVDDHAGVFVPLTEHIG